MRVLLTGYEVRDMTGCQFVYILSSDRDAIRQAVVAGVNVWLDEVLSVPRDELRGHYLSQVQINVIT